MKTVKIRVKSNARSMRRDEKFAALDQMDPALSSEVLAMRSGCSTLLVKKWRIRKLIQAWANMHLVAPRAADSLLWTLLLISDFDGSPF